MQKIRSSLILALLFFQAASIPLSARNSTADGFGNMAREIRVNRRIQDQLEDQTRILEYAVRRQQLTPSEQRKIENMMKRVKRLSERTAKKGSMTPSEAKSIRTQISKIYRTLWFLRVNEVGKGQVLHFMGEKIVLRERYRTRISSSRLDQQEMARILHTYYKACRLREQLKDTSITPREKSRIKRECFTILSEYFTLAETEKKSK